MIIICQASCSSLNAKSACGIAEQRRTQSLISLLYQNIIIRFLPDRIMLEYCPNKPQMSQGVIVSDWYFLLLRKATML